MPDEEDKEKGEKKGKRKVAKDAKDAKDAPKEKEKEKRDDKAATATDGKRAPPPAPPKKRLPPPPLKRAAPASSAGTPTGTGTPVAAVPRRSLLQSTMASLSKGTPEKKPEAAPERPRAGAWTEPFVLSHEQETQFANASIQRSYAAAARAKLGDPPLRLQTAKDVYRLDQLAARQRGRSIQVPGNMGIVTTGLAARLVAEVLSGGAKY